VPYRGVASYADGATLNASVEGAEKVRELERENRDLKRANEILRRASAYFAQAELDRP
jgi:transposase